MGGDTRSQRVEAHADYLLRLHRREPDLTLNEICGRLERARRKGVAVDDLALFRPPRHHAQKKSAHASEHDRPNVLERRRRWFAGQLDLDRLKLVSVDETAATTTWRAATVGDGAGAVCAAACPTAITKRSPSSLACV